MLLAPGDRPIIADFGVARSAASARLTMTGHFVGTPAYMAPEQFDDVPPTFSVDQYALGAILHEMPAGRAPFSGKDALSIRAIKESPPPRLPADLPSSLGDIVTRLLQKDPAARYPKTTALAADLERVAGLLEAGRVAEAAAEGAADEGRRRRRKEDSSPGAGRPPREGGGARGGGGTAAKGRRPLPSRRDRNFHPVALPASTRTAPPR